MYYFQPDKLPVLTNLAKEFAVFNRWFASIPGPTLCNRAFAHYGTSFGHVSMELFYAGRQYKSIYERLTAANISSRVYYFDSASSTLEVLKRGDVDRHFSICSSRRPPASTASSSGCRSEDDGEVDQHPENAQVGVRPEAEGLEPAQSAHRKPRGGDASEAWRESGVREQNGPNDCATAVDRTVGEYGCPDPTLVTTNRVGTVGFRALVSRSGVSSGSRVPFYFQRTIGGSDIDGERLLASYDDYRFRAPNLIVFQQTFEHVVWGPLGAFAAAEQGRVARIDDPLTQGELRKTFGAGLTLRAGGVPMVTIWWADGGPEGHHVAITMNTSLLGGSSRPSLR